MIKRIIDKEKLEEACHMLLDAIGEDMNRGGIQETPKRYAKWWEEFIGYTDDNIGSVFMHRHVDQLVVLSGIRVWSICEHHLLPFWCDISIGYITTDKVIGISKLARIARLAARKLQVQERLVAEIADIVQDKTGSKDVAVIGSGKHLCMLMRGVETDAVMTSSEMRGAFREDHNARAEFLRLCNGN